MAYVLGPNKSPEGCVLERLDHVICRIPDIERFHTHFRDVLGFGEAWPIGQFWPEGRTSGIALGGINLEFLESPGVAPAVTKLVFEPTSIDEAAAKFDKVGVQTRAFDKIEADPALLALRGFTEEALAGPQLICRNLLLESEFPIDMFLCDYSPGLRERLAPDRFPMPYGKVLRVELELPKPGAVWKLGAFGYKGRIEFYQSEDNYGPCRVTGIMFESGAVDLKGIDPGFQFV
jgi:hypothetical protein